MTSEGQQPRRVPQNSMEVLGELNHLGEMLRYAVQELRRLDRARLQAVAIYEEKRARVYVHAEGTERTRAELTRLECSVEWLAMEEAKSDVRTQREMIDALGKEIESMRSVGATLRSEINLGRSGAYGN